LCVVSIYKS